MRKETPTILWMLIGLKYIRKKFDIVSCLCISESISHYIPTKMCALIANSIQFYLQVDLLVRWIFLFQFTVYCALNEILISKPSQKKRLLFTPYFEIIYWLVTVFVSTENGLTYIGVKSRIFSLALRYYWEFKQKIWWIFRMTEDRFQNIFTFI